ncbi:hypothetical protein DL546_007028 [Coniochaeta pulveracea]|uniref:BZIP domain-containing protein n=1 Tax=Coniochaeta pulveracea TaxID=177199 RepID=A0A420YJF0_9PEZI|nr:hypothetical protein DL546_007028 [Coniochaeta pulveracea]
MSQRGSASRPASRRLTGSKASPEAAAAAPTSSSDPQLLHHAGPPRGDDLQALTSDDLGGIVAEEEQARAGPMEFKGSGVYNLLNPVESLSSSSRPRVSAPQRLADEGSSGSAMEDRKRSGRPNPLPSLPPLVAPGQATQFTVQSTYPSLAPLPEPAPVAHPVRHGSPTIAPPPLPPVGAPRRQLAPMSPRAAILSRASPRAANLQQPPQPPQPSVRGSIPAQYVSPPSGPGLSGGLPQIQTLVGQGGAGFPRPFSPGVMRSASHAALDRSIPQALSSEQPQPPLSRVPILHPGAPQSSRRVERPPPPPSTQDMLPAAQYNESVWGGGMAGSGPVRSWPRGLSLGEAQPMFAITPQSGEEILIPVDTHQGSKSADERRLRNAGASQRFRSRKKERENQMEAETRRLNDLVRGLEQQRDFYRNERNRLRDIVSRTPSISEYANGPPTPTPAQSAASSETENRPLVEAPRRRTSTQTRPYPYGSDETSSIEPPPRKRRADGKTRSRWRSPPYEPHPTIRSATVPTALTQAPRPSPASFALPGAPPPQLPSPGTARLPVLRMESQAAPTESDQALGIPPPSTLVGHPSHHQPQPRPPHFPAPHGQAPPPAGWAVYPGPSEESPR